MITRKQISITDIFLTCLDYILETRFIKRMNLLYKPAELLWKGVGMRELAGVWRGRPACGQNLEMEIMP